MMEAVFLHLLNMSITAGWLVLAVLLLRLVFRRAPKWIHCLLWVMVALRLIFPVSIESVLSVIPSAQTVPVDTFLYDTPTIQSGLPAVDGVVNPMLSDSFAPQPMDSVNPMQVVSAVAANLWVLGMVAMALYAIISTVRLHRRVRESVRLRDNIFQCDRIATPFILGIIRPRIYLPTTLSEDDRLSVVAHELAHIRRRDHWWKPLGFLLLTVYWFHPLLWLGYVLLCRDIEAACDQRVIRDMDVPLRKAYSETLLACSAPRHLISACPLAFGETGVKSRIKSVLNYKKPAFWLIIVAVVATVVAAVCLLTDPKPVVSDELDAYLTHVILEQNYSEEHTGDAYPTEAHTVFGTRKKDGKLTVYAMVLYEEYYLDDLGELQVQSGSHIPTAITVDMEGSAYSLVEYWIPGDGTHYLPDMKEKFPFIYRIQVDTAKYYDIHQPRTLAAAKAHFGRNDEPNYEPTADMFTVSHVFQHMNAMTQEKQEELFNDLPKDSDPRRLPVVPITTTEELDVFIQKYFSSSGNSAYHMRETYTDTFFAHNVLLAVYHYDGSGSLDPRIVALDYTDNGTTLQLLVDVYSPYMQTHDMCDWFMMCSVPYTSLNNATEYTAVLRGSVPLNYYVATYENTSAWADIKTAPETWRDRFGVDEFELDEVLNPLDWVDLGTQVDEYTFVGEFNLHNINYYVSSDYTLICTEQQAAYLDKEAGDYFRALFKPRDDLRYVPPYRKQLTETTQDSANKSAKRNCWHTLSEPMPRSAAVEITGGYTLDKRQVAQLKAIVGEAYWKFGPDQDTELLCDAYFSFNGSSRYYVYLDTSIGSFIYKASQYFMLTKEQCDIIKGLMTDKSLDNTTGSTTQTTTTTQAKGDDANTFVGKVTRVTDTEMLMECYDKDKFNEVWVSFKNYPDLDPRVGDEFVVTHSGWVMETYPPQVTAEEITPVSSTPTINH